MRLTPRSICVLVAPLALVSVATSAFAAPYTGQAYEPFDYSLTNDVPNDQSDVDIINNNGGTGFNATGDPAGTNTAWTAVTGGVTVTAGSLAPQNIPATGNRLSLAPPATPSTTNAQAFRGIGQTVDSGTVYFSYAMQRTNGSFRTTNFALYSGTGGTGSLERFAIGQFGSASGTNQSNGDFAVTVNVPSGTTNPPTIVRATTPVAVGTNVQHLVVARVDLVAGGLDTLTVYIDPTSTDEASATPYIQTSQFEIGAFDHFRPFAGNATTAANQAATTADYDEIRFGTTYASVALVPEPGSAALVLGAAGCLAMRRRRRRRSR